MLPGMSLLMHNRQSLMHVLHYSSTVSKVMSFLSDTVYIIIIIIKSVISIA